MAGLSSPFRREAVIVEPAAGAGILVAALAEQIAQGSNCRELNVIAYETDTALRPALALTLGFTRDWLSRRNIRFDFTIRSDDFLLANAPLLRPTPLFATNQEHPTPQLVIANPPYFKLPKSDPRVSLLADVTCGQPNIYALFMAAAAKLLQPEGQLIFITPRSFCSGPYFRQFRKWFFQTVSPERLHLFESRTETFEHAQVIQETVILAARKSSAPMDSVTVSGSHNIQDLEAVETRQLPLRMILDLDSSEAMLNIPLWEDDHFIQERFDSWRERLSSFGLHISTGPIVPFRTDALIHVGDDAATAPVLWGQHIGRMSVTYP
ncbi:MAG: Eco57I restriction-modification methylase domain-containing protein, partial [Chloroflexota bacterium]